MLAFLRNVIQIFFPEIELGNFLSKRMPNFFGKNSLGNAIQTDPKSPKFHPFCVCVILVFMLVVGRFGHGFSKLTVTF